MLGTYKENDKKRSKIIKFGIILANILLDKLNKIDKMIHPLFKKLMNKLIIGLFGLLVLVSVGEINAQTFRTFQTTTQEITYTNRTLSDGSVVVETVIETVVVDLTPNPVTAESTVSTDTKEETLFLTQAAATALQTAIASAESSASASDTVIAETVAAEVDDNDKAQDSSGNVLEEITYVEVVNGVPTFTTVNDDTVETNDVVTTERAEFTTIVEEAKAIVSQN